MKNEFSFLKLLLFSFVFFLTLSAQSQQKKEVAPNKQVSGQVQDTKGKPIAGVSVAIKGTEIAVVTDELGKFKFINVSPNAKILVISHMGMKTQEVLIKSKAYIEIRLEDDFVGLEQVVVVGYGTQKKASVVGAISTVKAADLVRSGIPSVANSLTGLVPGMITDQASGLPGSEDAKIYIRGLASFTGNNQPLVLVDGIERGLNDLDPSEVESVSVLKDASATAIFGVKGGNGVILITTKRGQEGRMEIAATFDETFKKATSSNNEENAYTMLKDRDQLYRNQNSYAKVLGDTMLNHYLIHDLPYIYPDVNAWKYMMKPFGTDTRASVSARGGTKNSKYFLSVAYLHEGDLLKSTQTLYDASTRYDRLNFRMNFDFDLSKTTKLGISSGGYVGVQNTSGAAVNANMASTLNNLYTLAPYAGVFLYPASVVAQYPDPLNPGNTARMGANLLTNGSIPYWNVNGHGTSRVVNDRLGADITLNQKLDVITPGLTFKGLFSYNNDASYSGGGILYNADSYTLAMVGTTPTWTRFLVGVDNYSVVAPPYQTALTLNTASYPSTYPSYNYVYSGQLDYKHSFKKHTVGALGVFQRRISQAGWNFKHFEENWVGRATYDYDSKYLLEASVAISGSEQFAPQNRFGYFPSIAAGWNIAKEKIVQKLIPQMNNLKVRYSWGQTGNDNTGTQWLYISQYTNWTAGNFTGVAGSQTNIQTVREGSVPNLDAQWERATKQDLGFEFGFFNRLNFSLDLYDEQRTGILMSRNAVADWFGQTILPLNIGATKRHGYEFEIGYNGVARTFNYWIKGNYNFTENRVVNQDDPLGTPDYLKAAGKPIGVSRSNVNLGYYQNPDDIANYSLRQSSLMTPGNDKQLDFSGDATTGKDGIPMGNTSRPNKTFSLSAGIVYKKFDFSFMFQGVTSVDRNMGSYSNPLWTNDPGEMYIQNQGYNNVWTPANPNAAYAAWGAYGGTGKAIQSAKYIRLKTLELGYSLMGNVIKKMGFSSARLALQGANLFTWAPGITMGDPENEIVGSDQYQYAMQFYPIPRRLTIALKVNF